MSRSRISRAPALPSRLLHATLRLKVMAGVVVVTLLALTVFDVGVVITMRRYLLAQTDNNLQVALTVTKPTLSSLISERIPRPPRGPRQTTTGITPANFKIPALPGDFDIALVPVRGPAVVLEIGTGAGGRAHVGHDAACDGHASRRARPAYRADREFGIVSHPYGPCHWRFPDHRHQP
jgi:hypothetical protein